MIKNHNISLKIFAALLFISAVTLSPAKAQFLDNRLNIYFAYSSGAFMGDPWTDTDGLITPSLFANLSGTNGVSSSFALELHEWISATFYASVRFSGNWSHSDSKLYQNADLQYYYLAPGLRFQSPYRQLGLMNRARLFADVSYGGGQALLSLSEPMMIIEPVQGDPEFPDGETNFFHGWNLSLGFQYTINPSFGLFASYSLHSNRIDGRLFTETGFITNLFEVGLFFRLMDKRRYYL